MSESMVERVAAAMADNPPSPVLNEETMLPSYPPESHHRAARAAIEAMREPTIPMMNAAGNMVPEGPLQAEEIFNTMIGAALAELE